MNSYKKIHRRSILISAVAAAYILAVSGSGNAATTGAIPSQQAKTAMTSALRGASTSTANQVNSISSESRSTWRGATRAEWTQRWWRWWMSIPLGVGPTNDTKGAQCGINQSGPVWFIGGPLGSPFETILHNPKRESDPFPHSGLHQRLPLPSAPNFRTSARSNT